MEIQSKIRAAVSDPRRAVQYLHRECKKRVNKKRGIDFIEEDWDNLLILDGCRYDLFQDVNDIEGQLSAVRSNASSSQEFFRNNFHGRRLDDLVLFSANTSINRTDAEFCDIYRLWETLWDERTGTVPPSDVTEFVLDHERDYRDKRIVVHYMQPHMPFLMSVDGEIKRHPVSGNYASKPDGADISEELSGTPWWDQLEQGEISHQETWAGYRETLEVSLPYVEKLVDSLPGKTVISADHGNAFGENDVFGHPSHIFEDVVVTVPWLEIEGERKNIKSSESVVSTKESTVDKEKLRALGYLD